MNKARRSHVFTGNSAYPNEGVPRQKNKTKTKMLHRQKQKSDSTPNQDTKVNGGALQNTHVRAFKTEKGKKTLHWRGKKEVTNLLRIGLTTNDEEGVTWEKKKKSM